MVSVLMWNMLAWLLWGLLILGLRYRVERQHQKFAERDAQDALLEV
jgi:hypothetical protein